MSEPQPSHLLKKLGTLLEMGPEGLFIGDDNREKLIATVELGARLPPSKSIPAVMDVIRFMLALRQEGHEAAAATVEAVIDDSAAAIQVINRIAEVTTEAQQKQLGGERRALPASVEQKAQAGGMKLKDMLPPGVSASHDPARAGEVKKKP